MSRRVLQRPQARQDIRRIVDHIADDNPDAAGRFFEAYLHTLEALMAHPARGRRYTPNHVFFKDIRVVPVAGFGAYLVFSRERADRVEIIRVLHGARDLLPALEEELPPDSST